MKIQLLQSTKSYSTNLIPTKREREREKGGGEEPRDREDRTAAAGDSKRQWRN